MSGTGSCVRARVPLVRWSTGQGLGVLARVALPCSQEQETHTSTTMKRKLQSSKTCGESMAAQMIDHNLLTYLATYSITHLLTVYLPSVVLTYMYMMCGCICFCVIPFYLLHIHTPPNLQQCTYICRHICFASWPLSHCPAYAGEHLPNHFLHVTLSFCYNQSPCVNWNPTHQGQLGMLLCINYSRDLVQDAVV